MKFFILVIKLLLGNGLGFNVAFPNWGLGTRKRVFLWLFLL